MKMNLLFFISCLHFSVFYLYAEVSHMSESKNSWIKLLNSQTENKYIQPQPPDTWQRKNDWKSMDLILEPRQNICDENQCICQKLNHAFITVTCDFGKNTKLNEIFDKNLKVPNDATSIIIKLSPKTKFQLKKGFFLNNTVNSFTIQGTYSEAQQAEICTDAFDGNNGPYPDIHLINVFSVILRTRAFSGGSYRLSVKNSNDLIIFENCFDDIKLNGHFMDIKDLRIEEKAFNTARAKLRIEKCHMDNIYRLEASIHEIHFVNSSIGIINSGTFDVITINSIVFEDCVIDTIKARAITEKLLSKYVSIRHAVIGSVESEAIYGSGISELVITNNRIDTIQENAIFATAINATIADNNIKYLGNNWLRLRDWSNIVVENNQFGDFGGITLDDTRKPTSCLFDNNFLNKPFPGCLNLTNRYCVLRKIHINLPCRCNLDWLYELSSHDLRSETFCTIGDKLSKCFNRTNLNTLKFINEVCDERINVLMCNANFNLTKDKGIFYTSEEWENSEQIFSKPILLLFLVITIVIIIILSLATWRAFQRFTKNKQSKNINESTIQFSTAALNSERKFNHLHDFTENDLNIIRATLNEMKQNRPDIYQKIKKHTQKLLRKDLSEENCIKSISMIVNLLNNCADFQDFNRVLTDHLQQPYPSVPPAAEPLYTEQENLYSELGNSQHPLLCNEYSNPADRSSNLTNLYMEPCHQN